MSARRQHKAMVRWERDTRTWGTDRARRLVLDLYHDRAVPPLPYTVGIVPWPGERPLVEAPARCSLDQPVPSLDSHAPPEPPISTWLATDQRITGRLRTGVLQGWGWDVLIGVRVDLTPGREWLQFDVAGLEPVVLRGPGIAPLAVVAVWTVYGPKAMLDHPGLAVLRQVPNDAIERITQATPALER